MELSAEALARLRIRVESGDEIVPEGLYVADLPIPSVGFSTDAYVDVADFLVARGVGLRETFLYTRRDRGGDEAGTAAVIAAIEDLLWQQSERFLGVFHRSVPFDLFRDWGLHLARTGQPFHALKFLEPLRQQEGAARLPHDLAVAAAKCWVQVACFAPLHAWLPALAPEVESRAALAEEIDASIALSRRTRAACLDQNMYVLRGRYPDIAARIEELARRLAHEEPLYAAHTDECRWLFRRQSMEFATEDYSFLFHLQEGRIRPLNAVAQRPTQLREQLAATGSGAMLIGSLCPYDLAWGALLGRTTEGEGQARPTAYVVEPDLRYFACLLQVVTLHTLLGDPTVHWFVGPEAEQACMRFLTERAELPLPARLLRVSGGLTAQLRGLKARPMRGG